jgi:hypothetical protein
MPAPILPFWLIRERSNVLKLPAHEPCDDPKAAHCFTSAEKLSEFMRAHGGARWQIDQVADDVGVIVAVADLHQHGFRDLCVDPEADGSGGLIVSIGDLLKAYGK